MVANISSDNLPPHPRDKLIDDDGNLTSVWNDWLTSLRDQTLGKNVVSEKLILRSGDQMSVPSELLLVEANTAGEITLGNPQIKPGFNGQFITIQGTSATNEIKLTDGTGLSLESALEFVLGLDSVIKFHYDSTQQKWIEESRRA